MVRDRINSQALLFETRELSTSYKGGQLMKRFMYLSGIFVLCAGMVLLYSGSHPERGRPKLSPRIQRPEIVYLEAVNKVAPPNDPQILFLLMAQYSNANQQAEGAEFFS